MTTVNTPPSYEFILKDGEDVNEVCIYIVVKATSQGLEPEKLKEGLKKVLVYSNSL